MAGRRSRRAVTPLYERFTEAAATEARAAIGAEEFGREEAAGAAMTRQEIDEYILRQIDTVLAELDETE